MSISVHIDRLVLDGVDVAPAERPLLAAAVAAELARLLAAGVATGERWSSSTVPRMAAGPIRLPQDGSPSRLGVAVARAVHAAVRP